jgi:acyl-coenzyme A synthetase/AMP-(fatty) acid ligase
MQTSTPRDFGAFTRLFEAPDRIVVCQDGEEISAGQLSALALRFAETLDPFSHRRITLQTARADLILAALAAAVATGCELLLVRELYPAEDAFWMENEVAAVFDGAFNRLHAPRNAMHVENPAVLLTTSGTTGKPKVAVHDLDKLMGRVRTGQPDARWLLAYHPASFAGMQVLLTAFFSGGLLLAFAGLSASELIARTLDSGATHVSGTPTFWRALLLARRPGDASSAFRQITIGGEAVDQSTLDALQAAFPAARIIHIYASTEAGALFAVKDGRAGFPASWLDDGVEGCSLRIRESILQVQSPRAMRNYSRGGSGNIFTSDGWLITGDLVEVHAGRVIFAGRADNVINVGGGKVMPEQVEAALTALPFVKEARVSGVKNPLAGIILAADIVRTEPLPEAEVRQVIFAALSARLEPHKIPRLYRLVDRIPTNAVGKKERTES